MGADSSHAVGRLIGAVTLLCVALLSATLAHAAKYGIVTVDGTSVLATTAPDAQVLEVLARGVAVGASDSPANGYYRVRTAGGRIGWVAAEALDIRDYPASQARPARDSSPQEKFQRFAFRAHGGLNILSLASASAQANFPNGYGLSYAFGGAFGFSIIPRLAVLARGEYLLNSFFGSGSTAGVFYPISTGAVSVTGGLEFAVVQTPKFLLRLGAYGGAAPYVSHSAAMIVNTVSSTPLILSGVAPTFFGKVDGAVKVGGHFQVFVEAGYRYLTLQAQSTSAATGNTALIYNGSPVSIDFNGIMVLAGVGVTF